MGNKDKNKDQGDSAAATEGASGDGITSPRDACHANRDLSWEREARDATLAKQVVEAVAKEMVKEGKCMRCGKQEHQPGQKCPAKNAMCKDCYKIGHFHKACQSKKRAKQRANLVQTPQG